MNSHPTRASRRAEQKRRAFAPTRMLLAALGTAGAIVIGVLAGGGTFAVWATSASAASTSTVTAGSAALSLTPLSLTATDLYPGKTVWGTTTVRNDGTTPLTLSLQGISSSAVATAFTSALVVSAGTGSPANCTAGKVAPTAAAPLGAAANLGTTLAPGATVTLCIGVGLPAQAPAGAAGAASTALSLTVTGTQVHP